MFEAQRCRLDDVLVDATEDQFPVCSILKTSPKYQPRKRTLSPDEQRTRWLSRTRLAGTGPDMAAEFVAAARARGKL